MEKTSRYKKRRIFGLSLPYSERLDIGIEGIKENIKIKPYDFWVYTEIKINYPVDIESIRNTLRRTRNKESEYAIWCFCETKDTITFIMIYNLNNKIHTTESNLLDMLIARTGCSELVIVKYKITRNILNYIKDNYKSVVELSCNAFSKNQGWFSTSEYQ